MKKITIILNILLTLLLSSCLSNTPFPPIKEVTLTLINDEHCSVIGNGNYSANSEVEIKAQVDEHYVFAGWYINEELLSYDNPFIVMVGDEDLTIYATTTKEKYELSVNVNDSKMGNVIGSGLYSFNDEVILKATPNEGYQFLGFYDDNNELLSEDENYSFNMPSRNVSLNAVFSIITRKVSVTISHNSLRPGYVKFMVDDVALDFVNVGEFPIGTVVKMIPVANIGFEHIGWKLNNTFHMETIQEIVVSDYDQEWTCNFAPLAHYDYISYGEYPQTLFKDESGYIKEQLSEYEQILPSVNNYNNWNPYSDSVDTKNDPYMFYKDVKLLNDKYRGVFITQYRNTDLDVGQNETTDQEMNGFLLNTVYWFKYEPILWFVLDDKQEDELMLQTDKVIDAVCFNDSLSLKTNNEDTIYPNNYEHSFLRYYLNNGFYNLSFSSTEYIKVSVVNNDYISAGSSGDFIYTCNDTNDRLFVLSQNEAIHGGRFLNGVDRCKEATDYAKAMGVYVERVGKNYFSPWFLRSPRSPLNEFGNVQYVKADGSTNGIGKVTSTYIGLAPCFKLDISL